MFILYSKNKRLIYIIERKGGKQMLQIKNIHKEYKTGSLVQKALDGVSLNLRDNEFVAILGPSGSGKTTLLNIIGGLDRYDQGDLVINGISTKRYRDRDWDSYRNHTIGFVFQSYNLIPHQTVLANVELALTISGISKTERKQRAEKTARPQKLHIRRCGYAHSIRHHRRTRQARPGPSPLYRNDGIRCQSKNDRRLTRRNGSQWHSHQHYPIRLFRRHRYQRKRIGTYLANVRPIHLQSGRNRLYAPTG